MNDDKDDDFFGKGFPFFGGFGDHFKDMNREMEEMSRQFEEMFRNARIGNNKFFSILSKYMYFL
jgi:hypothetical protein